MNKIVLATTNKGKIRELQNQLSEKYQVLSLHDIGFVEDIEETGLTFKENSEIKAKTVLEYCKLNNIQVNIVIAEDSGILVEALPNHLGVFSKRDELFGGEDESDFNKNEKLIEIMKDKDNKICRYVSDICVVTPNSVNHYEGKIIGFVGDKQIGENGFAWDSIFYIDKNKSIACLNNEEKNKISHRGIALNKMLENFNL